MNFYFKQIPETPKVITSTTSIARLVDGLGFRYYWATEGLTSKEHLFSPGNGSMTITELNLHIYDLAFISYKTFGGAPIYKKEKLTTFESAREEILSLFEKLSQHLKTELTDADLVSCNLYAKKYDQEFPFWYMLNGPIADALTHVGQITSWRRLADNPQIKGVNVFLGNQKT